MTTTIKCSTASIIHWDNTNTNLENPTLFHSFPRLATSRSRTSQCFACRDLDLIKNSGSEINSVNPGVQSQTLSTFAQIVNRLSEQIMVFTHAFNLVSS